MNYNNFLIASLPEISWEARPDYTMKQFIDENEEIFEPYRDGVEKILFLNEIRNLELVLKSKVDQPEGYSGNSGNETVFFRPSLMTSENLEKFIDDPVANAPENYPDDIIEFFETKKENKDRYNRIAELYSVYLTADENETPFFKYYLDVLSVIRTVVQAIRLNRRGLSLEENLSGNPEIISAIIDNRSASDFGLSVQYPFVPDIFSAVEGALPDSESMLDRILYDALQEFGESDLFGDHVIYIFLIGLFILDRWTMMNAEAGSKFIENMLLP
ncbi:MAG: DUF2764 family protein [Spirochaetes bacterium]|nr:DUF2764 family protein [Spirochaetota bacterium]